MQECRKDTTIRFRVTFVTAGAKDEMRVCDVQEFIREAARGRSASKGVEEACTRIWRGLTEELKEIGGEGVEVLACEEETVKALMKLLVMIMVRSAR